MTLPRRAFLIGAAGVGLAACSHSTGATGLVSGRFTSAAMHGRSVGWSLTTPPSGHPLRVLVALHGRAGNHRDAFTSLHLDWALASAVRAGLPPFAIASIDGGDHDYWHPRRSGNRAAMVLDEVLPRLAARGLDVSRVGFLGWSMGGYGALFLAGLLGARRCAVAVAESPAIWHHAGQSADGAFDDAADFDTHAIFGHVDRLRGIPLRIDCGASDGFAPVTRDLRAALSPTPAGGIGPGAHNAHYWRSQARAQLQFAGQHLTI